VAQERNRAVAVELWQAAAKLSQRDVDGSVNTTALDLECLADVDQHQLAVGETCRGLLGSDRRPTAEEHR
jgi:hypothetical protein